MTTIPERAMHVIDILRRDVPRPETLPILDATFGKLLRFPNGACPMGLHAMANKITPVFHRDFPICCSKDIEAFSEWWDRQPNAKAAMDEVWPV